MALLSANYITDNYKENYPDIKQEVDISYLAKDAKLSELKPEEITENVGIIKVNKTFKPGMDIFSLYEVTRTAWIVNPDEASSVDYILSVYNGIILDVFTVTAWFKACAVMNSTIKPSEVEYNRYEFVGNIAPAEIRNKYKGKSVKNLFERGNRHPVTLIFND